MICATTLTVPRCLLIKVLLACPVVVAPVVGGGGGGGGVVVDGMNGVVGVVA